MPERLRILIVAEHFLPGFRAGGPIRSIKHLLEWLGAEHDFWIFTRDHDAEVEEPYDVATDRWSEVAGARVYYASRARASVEGLSAVARELAPDVIYLNSFFAPLAKSWLWRRRFGAPERAALLLAPRGEFDAGALALKSLKKKLYFAAARGARLCHGLKFHATNESEAAAIRRLWPKCAGAHVAPNLPSRTRTAAAAVFAPKSPGAVRLVFCSRVTPKKNLLYLVEALGRVRGRVELAVVGPLEGPAYVERVQVAAEQLPENVTLTWHGGVPTDAVERMLREHHVFVLPTLGENHGHSIVEAWMAGLPTMVSDQTPWHDLGHAGWTIPLADSDAWVRALQDCVDLSAAEYERKKAAAFARAEALRQAPPLSAWREMLRWAAGN